MYVADSLAQLWRGDWCPPRPHHHLGLCRDLLRHCPPRLPAATISFARSTANILSLRCGAAAAAFTASAQDPASASAPIASAAFHTSAPTGASTAAATTVAATTVAAAAAAAAATFPGGSNAVGAE